MSSCCFPGWTSAGGPSPSAPAAAAPEPLSPTQLQALQEQYEAQQCHSLELRVHTDQVRSALQQHNCVSNPFAQAPAQASPSAARAAAGAGVGLGLLSVPSGLLSLDDDSTSTHAITPIKRATYVSPAVSELMAKSRENSRAASLDSQRQSLDCRRQSRDITRPPSSRHRASLDWDQ